MVSQEASAITGCFRRTNLGALAMESGLGPATARLGNGQRRFGLRLPEKPETLGVDLLQEAEAGAKTEAERSRPGLTVFTDGSRLDSGAAGCLVVGKNGQR